MTRIIYLGTPDFAVPALRALASEPGFDVVGVVTQPDRPAGRGQQVRMSAVKQAALGLNLPVFQPKTLRTEEALAHLQSWQPDVLVVAAFGQILRKPVLELAPHGSLNIHASLLPRWRGAAPIHYAVRAGDTQTGVTIMRMDEGLDTGPLLTHRAVPISPADTAQSMHDVLAELGAELLLDTLPRYLAGEITPTPQPAEGVTHAPTLSKEQGRIDWQQSALEIDRHVRAYFPWPGTFTHLDDKLLKIISGMPLPGAPRSAEPGTILAWEGGIAVQAGSGVYVPDLLQPAGKKQMDARAFAAGRQDAIGQRLT